LTIIIIIYIVQCSNNKIIKKAFTLLHQFGINNKLIAPDNIDKTQKEEGTLHSKAVNLLIVLTLLGLAIAISCSSSSSSDPVCSDLTVNIVGQGSVDIDPELECYNPGDTVELYADPDELYDFYMWESSEITFESGAEYLDEIELIYGSIDITLTAYFVPGVIDEGEPECYDEYEDTYNGGCNSDPEVFQTIISGNEIHGTSGHYMYQELYYRDTDWFEYVATGDESLTWSIYADFIPLLFIIDGTAGCDSMGIVIDSIGSLNDTLTITADITEGTYWLWAGPASGDTMACGAEYTAWFTAEPIVAVAKNTLKEVDSVDLSPLGR